MNFLDRYVIRAGSIPHKSFSHTGIVFVLIKRLDVRGIFHRPSHELCVPKVHSKRSTSKTHISLRYRAQLEGVGSGWFSSRPIHRLSVQEIEYPAEREWKCNQINRFSISNQRNLINRSRRDATAVGVREIISPFLSKSIF